MATSNQELIFLHLSDIHFVKNFSAESKYDLDGTLRHCIEQDIGTLIDDLDHVDGILISGDVAFGGKVEEYETARTWLKRLAEILGCDPGYVWTVPGNHDIDQSVQKDMSLLFDAYTVLRNSTHLDVDLREKLTGRATGPVMFQPLKNYHEQFAAKYGCPTTPKEPWWEDELGLNDGSTLRIRGLNSAIISSTKDDRDTCKLVLGSAQTEYRPENHVVYLTLCHHPPEWLLDGENAHQAMVAHSTIQLFGHKHSHRHEKINDTLRLYSGAVHPVRTEKKWDPRYYFISLQVEVNTQNKTRELLVKLYPRVWSSNDRAFVRDAGKFEGLYIIERLKLPYWQNEQDQTLQFVTSRFSRAAIGTQLDVIPIASRPDPESKGVDKLFGLKPVFVQWVETIPHGLRGIRSEVQPPVSTRIFNQIPIVP